eukprot:1830114-Rhodomonas_salina.2
MSLRCGSPARTCMPRLSTTPSGLRTTKSRPVHCALGRSTTNARAVQRAGRGRLYCKHAVAMGEKRSAGLPNEINAHALRRVNRCCATGQRNLQTLNPTTRHHTL